MRDARIGDRPCALEIYSPEVLRGQQMQGRHATITNAGLPWLVADTVLVQRAPGAGSGAEP